MPARGCNAGFQSVPLPSSRAYLISELSFRLQRLARGGAWQVGNCPSRCTAAIRARHGSFALRADATVARPGMSRLTAGSP